MSRDTHTLNRRNFLALTGAASTALAFGGYGVQPARAAGGSVTWAIWPNPGVVERVKQFSADYAKASGNAVDLQVVVGNYSQKILTQLSAGTAPDAFYVLDDLIAKLVETKSVADLTPYLTSPDAALKLDDIPPGLLGNWKFDGGIYGLTVDCNPKVFWFNKTLLNEAGVSKDPAQLQEEGTWNQAALDDLLTKVKATGKRGMVFEANWWDLTSWITTFGGKILDDAGKPVFHEDPKALAALEWLFNHMNEGTITYGGSLPQGQAADALFYGGQIATVQYGRWLLPNLVKIKSFEYDIAPLPSESGRDISPVAVYTAAMVVNANAKDPAAALDFAAHYCNADGQKFRLSEGGNAVPSVKGLESVVTAGGLPAHAQWFVDIANNGYTTPSVLVKNPVAASNFSTNLDTLIKSKPDFKTFAQKAAALMAGA